MSGAYLDLIKSGFQVLEKIVSEIERFLKVDNATLKRERLQYARALIEVDVSQAFLDEIIFENQLG